MSDSIRVAIVDDHPLFRDGAAQALADAGGIEVVGEGATAADALKLARDLAPDIILLDVILPGGGVEAAAQIAQTCPRVRTVMLTASENDQHVSSALQAGARGYLLKGSRESEIIETVRAVFRGESYVAPSLGARLLMQTRERVQPVDSDGMCAFTSREEDILSLLSRGKTNKEIALGLNCTERSVKHHMTNIMRKSNVRNRVEAVLKYRRRANGGSPAAGGGEDAHQPTIGT